MTQSSVGKRFGVIDDVNGNSRVPQGINDALGDNASPGADLQLCEKRRCNFRYWKCDCGICQRQSLRLIRFGDG